MPETTICAVSQATDEVETDADFVPIGATGKVKLLFNASSLIPRLEVPVDELF